MACAQAPGATPSPSPSPAPTNPPSQAAPAGLAGRTFLSTNVAVGDAAYLLVDGTRIRLTFDGNRLSVTAGCNTIGGNYTLDGDQLHFSGASMTEMGCDPARMSQDDWLVDFLGSGLTFTLSGNDLTLSNGTTVVTLLDREVAEPDQPLTNLTWGLTTLINGDSASSVPAGLGSQITFNDDGTFSANFGCNSGGGSYAIDGDAITFSDVFMTKMACAGGAGQLEQAVLFVLGSEAVTFAIDADQLSLMAGEVGLQFAAALDAVGRE
ncbi:MAG TPA: META domain-containing protein [Candidatus Limnocylindria bacterium]|nr:META domain-containing protein [Candidatus Limnocylindria bacterium]